MQKKGLIIDGYNLLFRAYFGYKRLIEDAKTYHTAEAVGIMLLRLIKQYEPTHVLIAQDKGKSFRHEQFEAYKAQRGDPPELFMEHIPLIWETLEAMGFSVVSAPGYEADDVIGSLAKQVDFPTYVVSADMDIAQVVRGPVKMLRPKKGKEYEELDREGVKSTFCVYPEQIALYKALSGDMSDNIPGIRGIGPKAAQQIIEHCSQVTDIQEHDSRFSAGISSLLTNTALSDVRMYLDLTTIHADIDMSQTTWEYMGVPQTFIPFAEKNNLMALIKTSKQGFLKKEVPSAQMSLFLE